MRIAARVLAIIRMVANTIALLILTIYTLGLFWYLTIGGIVLTLVFGILMCKTIGEDGSHSTGLCVCGLIFTSILGGIFALVSLKRR